jgi:PAS domain S-box-containing protein
MSSTLGEHSLRSSESKSPSWPSIPWDLENNNKQWYQDLVEHSQDLLCLHDLQGRLLSVNPGPARLLGYSVEEILRIPMQDLIAPEFHEQFDLYLREIERTGVAHGVMAILTRTGERRLWEYHNTLRTDGVEKPVVRGIAHDVTDRMNAVKALRNLNRKLSDTTREQDLTLGELRLFRTLLDHSNDAIEVVDPDTMGLLDVNEKMCLETGYSRDELLSMTVFDIDPIATSESVGQVKEKLRRNESVILETAHRRKNRTTFPVEVNIKRVQLDREYIVAVSRDITERKLRDGRLQEYERVVESLDEMIAVLGRDHRYVIANSAFLRLRNKTKEQVVGRHINEILSARVYETTIKEKLDECFRGNVVKFEMRYEYPGIGERDLVVTYLPVEGPAGIERAAVVIHDITDQKRAAALLKESEARFRAVHERAPVGIALVESKTGRFLQVNPKFCAIAGRTEQEMLRLGFQDITHPDDVAAGSEHLQQLINHQTRSYDLEKRYVRPNGEVVRVYLSVVAMWAPGENAYWHMAIVQDITARREAEEALRESEERSRLAQEAAEIGTFERNLETGKNRWTPQMEALYGLAPGTFPDSIKKFLELVHSEDRQQVAGWISDSLNSGEAKGEWRVIWPSGEIRWISGRWRVFKNAEGKPSRVIGMDFDITDRKQVEEELRQAKEKLTEEKLYLEKEIDTELGFEEIVGQSKALKAVMESAACVATSGATVLLLGETGTGKELVARAIHRLSQRAANPFIKLNCAAIPSGLLESELFGNEKGAFTGAVSKKIGRLELADKGTLFLDEIGEIALALQPKLLRVLQDQEFERLGGTQTLKVNFRLIAATNRDLPKEVLEHKFRTDLFYRLSVFPIRLPPLRERRDDIPLLARHFVQKCARRMGKAITTIPKRTMDALMGWDWPGNIRELENFIERSVILTQGSALAAPLSELQLAAGSRSLDETLEATERQHILNALRDSRGQISGPRGAATRLGLKRTTLQSKLKQMGISPRL